MSKAAVVMFAKTAFGTSLKVTLMGVRVVLVTLLERLTIKGVMSTTGSVHVRDMLQDVTVTSVCLNIGDSQKNETVVSLVIVILVVLMITIVMLSVDSVFVENI